MSEQDTTGSASQPEPSTDPAADPSTEEDYPSSPAQHTGDDSPGADAVRVETDNPFEII
jgi:hypothetical protein